ncbi:MAG: efflux RND transporter periplasmic adaptor subunit [Spirochaetales bacterium]|nr:efflux RND transporter periplasmic adaptor subunit [Spirochaetales bacterium]
MKNKLPSWLFLPALLVLLSACSDDGIGIEASGNIEATEVRVGTKVAGEIIEMPGQEGQFVKPGDVIARIDHSSLDLQLGQAKAGMDFAQAQLALIMKGARTEDIVSAQDQMEQAGTSLKMAEDDYKRMSSLFKKGSATQKQRDDAEMLYKRARTQYNTAQLTLKKLKNLARPEEIKSAEAKRDQALYTVKLLEKMISDCAIVSPVYGVITDKLAEQGELVGQNTSLFVVSDLSTVFLMIYVPEPVLGRIKLGMDVEVRTDSFPDTGYPGRIVYISPLAEFTPKNIQTKDERVKLVYGVKIEIDNKDGIFKPGMPADARITMK